MSATEAGPVAGAAAAGGGADPDQQPAHASAPRGLRARLLFALGGLLGAAGWFLRIRRGVVEDNLARAFPALAAAERRRIARACYAHLGCTLAEVALARGLTDAELAAWVAFDGFEKYQRALASGRGVVCAVAHFGNWELLGRATALRGVQLTAITRRLRGRFNLWILSVRREVGMEALGDKGVSADVLRLLRRGEVLAVAVDQNMRPRRGIFVDFFGSPACTTPAAAVYAQRAGAVLLMAFPVRQPDGTHLVKVLGPFEAPAGARGPAATLALTQQLTRAVEETVRAAPEQWYWLHRRWKTRPPAAG